MEKEKTITTINPATGKEINTYNLMTDDEMNEAIEACQKSFLKWREKSLEERAEVIKKIGESLEKNKDRLSKLMTEEMGKLLEQSVSEVELCSAICSYTAEKGAEELQDEKRDLVKGGEGLVTYSPIGIIYGIQPWNYPAYQVIRYAIVNLMAGNAVLLKHAANVSGTGKLIEEIFIEGGLPEDLFKVLLISHEQSNEVIKNDYVRGVTLTGSSKAGKEVGKKASAELKKVVLELGSNDAYIVLEDADIELAVEKCVKGRIYNNGETCIAAKRFVVVEAVYDEFKKGFEKALRDLKVGDPTNDENDLGPMARKDLRQTIHEQVQESVKKGANLVFGGEIPGGNGFYYPVTLLENVKPGQPAYDDELFGPVASLIKAKDADDAMRIANDSRFGLGGGIFSKDEEKAKELAKNYFDTGMVFINSFGIADPAMPFGGVKNSGFGREHGGFGMKEFVNKKALFLENA